MKKIMMNETNDQTMRELFDKYILSCEVKNLSKKTISSYMAHFNAISKYLDTNMQLTSFAKQNIDDFILERKSANMRVTTINSYLRTLRAFLYWCMDNDYLNRFSINLLHVDKIVKATYTEAELNKLLKKPNIKKCTFLEYKTWVLVSFLVSTGQRLGAISELKIEHLDFTNRLITFQRTKRRKSHIINMSDSIASILEEYLKYRKGNPEDYLFCNTYGTQAKINTLEENLIDYNHARGVTKTSAHLFRHTFAKNWIQAGGNQFELMRILDHTTLDMTNHYVNLYSSEVDMNKYDMLDKFNKKSIKLKER